MKGHPLDPIFWRKNVAVIGATERQGGVGRTSAVEPAEFALWGTVYPINTEQPSVLGIRATATSGRCQKSPI